MTSTNLLELIKNKLFDCEKEAIVTALGYNNKKNGLKRLDELISNDSILEWLQNSRYDFIHSSRSFLTKLCKVLHIQEHLYRGTINKICQKLKILAQMPQPYVFINTNFKRHNEPIFMLAYSENRRRLYIDKTKVLESYDEGLSIAKELVVNNFNKTNGSLPIWGKIDNYFYHVYDKVYIINRYGIIQSGNTEIYESKASLLIGNQEMSCLFNLKPDFPDK